MPIQGNTIFYSKQTTGRLTFFSAEVLTNHNESSYFCEERKFGKVYTTLDCPGSFCWRVGLLHKPEFAQRVVLLRINSKERQLWRTE